MVLLTDLDFSLPLKNPVIIFSLVLFIILFAPLLLNRLKIPPIIGLIIAGIIIGPYGLNLLLRDSSIVLFGTVGLLYIMFTAGLEIDMEEFIKSRKKSFVFGLFTFLIPMIIGSLAAYYVLGYTKLSSVLLASLFSSHTLLAYPIASRYGISRIRSVTMAIGGTIITDILALLVLAAIAGMTKGEIGAAFWLRLGLSSIVFAGIVFFIFPLIARWFFKKFDDNISQYIFVLAIVFLGSFLAEAAGLEAIIGAFLSGLSLNRFIPHKSALMNRINFVGSAIFIPFFLIGVGMLIDFSVLFKGLEALKVAGVMILTAVITKYIAAWATQKTFSLSVEERRMIFGLTNARVGASLAIVLVGYNIILGETAAGEPIRLLNEDILNGTILMILVTCTMSSLIVEKSSRNLAVLEENKGQRPGNEEAERILVSLAYPEMVTDLVDLALMIKSHQAGVPLYALHVVPEQNTAGKDYTEGKKMMDHAVKHALATDNEIVPLTRFDMNISNGIIYTIREQGISDVIIGLHRNQQDGDHFFGPIVERILPGTRETIFIYKSAQPVNTLKRIVVAVPPKAEFEVGFSHWFDRLYIISKETGLSLIIYATEATIKKLEEINKYKESPLSIAFQQFDDWDEFLIFTREVKKDDLFVIISSRKGYLSYTVQLEKYPAYLTRYFKDNSFIILYPRQHEEIPANDIEVSLTSKKPDHKRTGMFQMADRLVQRIFK